MKSLAKTLLSISIIFSASAAFAAPEIETVFSTPGYKGHQMRIILDRLVSLTKQSVPQSEISVSIYEFNLVPLAEALVEASRRGVNVRMVIDGKIKGDSAKSKSAVGIVTNGLPKGAVTFCSGGGCRGTHINHNKLFLFSRLENGDRFVVAQTSSNMADDQLYHYNDLIIFKEDQELFNDFSAYWSALQADEKATKDPGDFQGSSNVSAFRYPRLDKTDPVLDLLNRASCKVSGSKVRIVQSRFDNDRASIAQRLEVMSKEGCDVKVISRVEPSVQSPGSKVVSSLGKNLVVLPYKGSTPETKSKNSVHTKIVMIEAAFDGSSAARKIVLTGSHNLNKNSLTKNDEILFKIEDAKTFDGYFAFWNQILNDAIRDGAIQR